MSNWSWQGQINDWTNKEIMSDSKNRSHRISGLELFFNEDDAGSFGNYRCSRETEFGKPFSILVEGVVLKNSMYNGAPAMLKHKIFILICDF